MAVEDRHMCTSYARRDQCTAALHIQSITPLVRAFVWLTYSISCRSLAFLAQSTVLGPFLSSSDFSHCMPDTTGQPKTLKHVLHGAETLVAACCRQEGTSRHGRLDVSWYWLQVWCTAEPLYFWGRYFK